MSHVNAPRLAAIDALRGLAVLLMMDQHVIYWLIADLGASGFMLALSGLGGLAAPLFVVLSGMGATLTTRRREHSDRILVLRGLGLVGLGYGLNVLTPSWFTVGSWYVLHMIGIAMVLAPVITRAPSWALGALVPAILISTVLIQNRLDTPFRLYNAQMSDPGSLSGLARHALAEGYFPIFPWIAFFVLGVLSGRWLLAHRMATQVRVAALMLLVGTLLGGLTALAPGFAPTAAWARFFTLKASFYPALTPISLLLMSATLLLVAAFASLQARLERRPGGLLVCLGRCSLTLLIVHVVIVRETAVRLGFFRSFSPAETFLLAVGIVAAFCLLALAWRRVDFRFGAEWLLRRAVG